MTVALKRFDFNHPEEDIYTGLKSISDLIIMPNTSGAKTSDEAYKLAHIGRELSGSKFVKIEIHPDISHLLPDPIETFNACKKLVKEDFFVMPYIHSDPVLAKRLEEIGCAAVMPLGAPIGSAKGLLSKIFIELIIMKSNIPVIIDAGLRSPADAAYAMESGADAILVNTAIALSDDPVSMGKAFNLAIQAGRMAYLSGIVPESEEANPTSPQDLNFLK